MKTTTLVTCLTGGLLAAACGSEAAPIEPPETSDPEGDAVVIATAEAVATAAAATLTSDGAGGSASAGAAGGTTTTSGWAVGGAASTGTGGSPVATSSPTESGGSAGASPSGQGGAGGSAGAAVEGPSTSTSTGAAGGAGQPVTTGEPLPPPPIPIGAVFITEYVEGVSNDKAIELSNLSAEVVSLIACRLEIYFNDNPEVGATTALAVDLGPGASHVLCHTSASAEIRAVCDQTGQISFNGNDTVVLRCNDVVHDSFGQVGFDGSVWRNSAPSSGTPWTGPFSSVDHVLRRRCDVAPHTEPTEPFEVVLAEGWFPAWSFEAPRATGAPYDGLGDPACTAPDSEAGAGGAPG